MLVNQRPKLMLIVTADISATFFSGQIEAFKQNGLDVILVSSPGKMLESVAQAGDAEWLAIPMKREIAVRRDLISLYRLFRAIRKHRPGIVDASTPKAGLLGMLAAKSAGVACRVYTLRGLRVETASGLKRYVLLLTERLACRCATEVSCFSPSLRRRALELKLGSANKLKSWDKGTSVGIDIECFTPRPPQYPETLALRQKLGIPDGACVIGFVGRFTRDKGVAELVGAFATISERFPDARLLMVGDYESGDPVPHDIRRTMEGNPRILRTGFVRDTASYYGLMDLLALPTYREGLPTAPLEAQASGVPVVTTNATGAVDSIIPGVTGLCVEPRNETKLAEAILELLSDSSRRRAMGEAGRTWVVTHFRKDMVAQKLLQQYFSMLSSQMPIKKESAQSA